MSMEKNMQSPSSQLKNLEVIKATAGAGKTTTLITAVKDQILNFYNQHKVFPKIVVSTFTRKATAELKERLMIQAIKTKNPQLIDYISYSPQLQISTLHGVFHQFLKLYGQYIGLSPGFTVTQDSDLHLLFNAVLKKQLLEHKKGVDLLEHYSFDELQVIVKQYILYIKKYENHRPFNKEELVAASHAQKQELMELDNKKKLQALNEIETNFTSFIQISSQLQILGIAVQNAWQKKQQQIAQVTFDDLETMLWALLCKKMTGQKKLFFPKWDFWFLDEYQDTSLLQKKILDVLTTGSKVFIVGDPQQSIYRFRDADTSVFLAKIKEAQNDTQSSFKEQIINFRSDGELVAFFNDFFTSEHNMQSKYQTWDAQKIVAHFVWMAKQKNTHHKQQAQFEEVRSQLDNLLTHGVSLNDIVILARKNNILNKLASFLKKQNILVHLHLSNHFQNQREIKDALFLLRFLCNPHHNSNLVGLLRTPYYRVEDATLVEWTHRQIQSTKFHSLWSFCEQTKHSVITVLKSHLKDTKNYGIVQSFQNALISCGLMDLAYYQDPTGMREANLWKLVNELIQYEQTGTQLGSRMSMHNILFFVDRLLLDAGGDIVNTDSNKNQTSAVSAVATSGVQLMTVHAAKGLEFDHVILLDIGDEFKPHRGSDYFVGETGDKNCHRWSLKVRGDKKDTRISSPHHENILSRKKEEELQEEDRLLYVALTRAKKTVTLIGSASKGNSQPGKNSWMDRNAFFKNTLKKIDLKKMPVNQTQPFSTEKYSFTFKYIMGKEIE